VTNVEYLIIFCLKRNAEHIKFSKQNLSHFQNDVFDPKLHQFTFTQVMDYNGVELDIRVQMTMVLLPIILSCWIRDLKYLVPLSLFANIAMLVGICVTLYYITQDLPAPSTREYIAPWSRIPLFFGTVIYAFEGIGLVCEAGQN
jgi:amino acid permease